VISPTLDSLRIFLHVLAASVWVGGQIVLGGLVPQVRRTNPEALHTIARAFGRVAWPAYGVAFLTGVWSLLAVDPSEQGSAYTVTLAVKLLLVGVAAAASIVHSLGSTKLALALGGAVGLVSSLAVMWLGVLLSNAG
jgi:putative copper export protein